MARNLERSLGRNEYAFNSTNLYDVTTLFSIQESEMILRKTKNGIEIPMRQIGTTTLTSINMVLKRPNHNSREWYQAQFEGLDESWWDLVDEERPLSNDEIVHPVYICGQLPNTQQKNDGLLFVPSFYILDEPSLAPPSVSTPWRGPQWVEFPQCLITFKIGETSLDPRLWEGIEGTCDPIHDVKKTCKLLWMHHMIRVWLHRVPSHLVTAMAQQQAKELAKTSARYFAWFDEEDYVANVRAAGRWARNGLKKAYEELVILLKETRLVNHWNDWNNGVITIDLYDLEVLDKLSQAYVQVHGNDPPEATLFRRAQRERRRRGGCIVDTITYKTWSHAKTACAADTESYWAIEFVEKRHDNTSVTIYSTDSREWNENESDPDLDPGWADEERP